ncbi:hypothetical protein AKJ49_02190, partial [candidate division MSBL1 archaeon SCGC-AAA382A03]
KKEKKDEGFFSKWKATVFSGFSFHERYYDINPHAILQESEDNYEIRPEEIKSIKMKGGSWNPDYNHNSSNEMEIKWTGGKNKFKFDQITPKKVKKAFNPLLKEKIN